MYLRYIIERNQKKRKSAKFTFAIRDFDSFKHQLCLINFIAGCLLDVIEYRE